MENSQLAPKTFDVVFDPDDRSLHYSLNLNSEITGYVVALIDVYAYGFKIITKQINPCDIDWKQFCPVTPGEIEVESIQYISEEYVKDIPGIAYTVPDIDAFARVNVVDLSDGDKVIACIQAFFTNGKTVSQIGVKWATAVVAGLGLLVSAMLSAFGNSTAASHISANTMSLFLYFQSVVVVSMQHAQEVPPIAAAWAENLAWSMGLIRITFMQKIFRWYVQSTGGNPSLYLTSTTISILVQRGWNAFKNSELMKRASQIILYGNSNVLIFRGIRRMAYQMHIENTSVVVTGFTFFVLCGYVLAGFIIFCKSCIELSIRAGWLRNTRFLGFRSNWRNVLKGALLRYVYIGFTQLTILSFWEFLERDSPAVIVIACLFIVLTCGLMLWASFRTIYFARVSVQQHSNPAAILYGDEVVLNKYGFFYTMFSARFYYWGCVVLCYNLVKAAFTSFSQQSGQTQALAIFIIDLVYFIILIVYQPYLDRVTNIFSIFITTVTLINSFLFMFFSGLFKQPRSVASIMGWVFFILNAAFSFVLLILIIVYTCLVIFSKNPDLRFKPAKDDRTSFQRNASTNGPIDNTIAAELLALGNAAKDHEENWEDELYKGQKSEKGSTPYENSTNVFSGEVASSANENLLGLSNNITDELNDSSSNDNGVMENDHTNDTSSYSPGEDFDEKNLRSNSGKRQSKGLKGRLFSLTKKFKKSSNTSSRYSDDGRPVTQLTDNSISGNIRPQSEANNGLMSSYRTSEQLDDGFEFMDNPNALEERGKPFINYNDASGDFNTNSRSVQREDSMHSFYANNHEPGKTDLV
ncbi:transient receptor potential ion channel family protein SCDLUD_001128 [Saccharomycodes ludwigii]|nr:hypothetical protein SCDLUD_001128 [Saccharomycodes ludwigii]KAH3903488.1 hypothetical protein SCDLUD_001128 [Saccharomycodes ludwigii]